MPKNKNTSVEAEVKQDGDSLELARQAFLQKKDIVVSDDEQQTSLMTDEPVVSQESENIDDTEVRKTIPFPTEFTEIEKEAIRQGWVPEEEFWGDKSKWKPAEDWVRNTENYERQSQKKRLETIEKQQRELLELFRSERAEKINITLNNLKEKRREAILNNDIEKENEIDNAIAKLQGQIPDTQTNNYNKPTYQSQNNIDTEALAFAERNKSWFNQNTPDNTAMMAYAIAADKDLGEKYPTMTIQDRFSRVESLVAKRFNTSQPQNVLQAEPRRSSVNVRRDHVPTYQDISDKHVKEIIDHYVSRSEFIAKQSKGKHKPKTRDDYVKQLFNDGTIDKNGNAI